MITKEHTHMTNFEKQQESNKKFVDLSRKVNNAIKGKIFKTKRVYYLESLEYEIINFTAFNSKYASITVKIHTINGKDAKKFKKDYGTRNFNIKCIDVLTDEVKKSDSLILRRLFDLYQLKNPFFEIIV